MSGWRRGRRGRALGSWGRIEGGKCSCGSSSFIHDRESGEIICSQCGTVLYTDNIDQRPEWRLYNDTHKEKRTRIGSPLSYLDADLGVSSSFSKSPNGKESAVKGRKVKRLSKIQARTGSPLKRRLDRILQEIKIGGEKLSLARHEMETAAKIARKGIILDQKKRWNNTALAAAAIYIACRLTENNKKLGEITKSLGATNCNKKEVTRACRLLTTKLKLKPPLVNEEVTLRIITKKMRLNRDIIVSANQIIKTAKKARIGVGKNPGSIAAAAVYIAFRLMGQRVTQREICVAAKTTEVTLRSRVKDIVRNLSITAEV